MRDTEGLSRIYPGVRFTRYEYKTYANVFNKIRSVIIDTFGLVDLWFTAPTFITRLIGNEDWQPGVRPQWQLVARTGAFHAAPAKVVIH